MLRQKKQTLAKKTLSMPTRLPFGRWLGLNKHILAFQKDLVSKYNDWHSIVKEQQGRFLNLQFQNFDVKRIYGISYWESISIKGFSSQN